MQNLNRHQFEESFLKKLNTKCTQRDNSSCLMLKWMAYMNRMLKKSTIDVGGNFQLSHTGGVAVQMAADAEQSGDQNSGGGGIDADADAAADDLLMSRAARSDEEQLAYLLADKIWTFFRSRTLRYRMLDNAEIIVAPEPRGNVNIGLSINPSGAFEVGRGRIRHLAPLLAAVATKVGIIGALVLKGLVLLVGKALIVSKIALVLALLLGLKKLLAKKHVTYEVVAHPHHAEHSHAPPSHDSYSAGWGRAFDGFLEGLEGVPLVEGAPEPDAHEQAYAGQARSL